MKGQFQQERLSQAYSQEHFFLLISKLTKESFGYGDSILIVIMGAFLGFWSLMSVLFMAFFMAGLFSVIMLLKTKFHKKIKVSVYSVFNGSICRRDHFEWILKR